MPAGVPEVTDTAVLEGTGSVEVSHDTTVSGLTLAQRLSGSGTLTVLSQGRWTSGELAGRLGVASGAVLTLASPADKSISGGQLINQGRVVWADKGTIVGVAGGAIANHGVFEIQNDLSFAFCCQFPQGTFHNFSDGVVRKTVATGTTAFGDFIFENEGTLDIQSGVLLLQGGVQHQLKSGSRFSGAGVTRVSGTTVTLTGTAILDAGGTFELSSGALAGTGSISGPGSFLWSGGDLAGGFTIETNGHLSIAGAAEKRLYGGSLVNRGTAVWRGSGNMVGVAGGSITNRGVFELQNDAVFAFCCQFPRAAFWNMAEGILRKTGTSGTSTFGDFRLENQGRIEVLTGTLLLQGGENHQLSHGGHLSGPGVTRIADTTVTLSGTTTVDLGGTLEFVSGALNGTGSLAGPGTFLWLGGDLSGTLTLAPTANTVIDGAAEKRIPGGTLVNQGTLVWRGAGNVTLFAGAELRNTGTFESRTDARFQFCCQYPIGTFKNLPGGLFRKSNSTGTNSFEGVSFNNDGLVDVQSGVLVLGSGGSGSGTFTNAPGARVELTGGTMTLKPGIISGWTRISGGTVILEGVQNIGANGILELASGTLGGIGSVAGPGAFRWSGGDLTGALTLEPLGSMFISGDAEKRLSGGNLLNRGRVVWRDNGSITGVAGGSITNRGVFELQSDAAFAFCCQYPVGAFRNFPDGVLRKTGSSGTSQFGEFLFENRGTVDIQTGVLALTGTPSHQLSDGGRFTGAGVIRVTNATVTLAGVSTLEPGATLELASGTLIGAGSIVGPGSLHWTGGDLGGKLVLSSSTTLRIDGAAEKRLSGSALGLEGRTLWSGTGPIVGIAGASITNSGVFEIRTDADFSFCCAYPIARFHNQAGALLRKTSGGETAFAQFDFENHGRLSIQAGTLRLPDGTIIQGVCPVRNSGSVGLDLLPSGSEALLTWTPPVIADGGDNVSVLGFEVQKSVDGGSFATVATLAPGVLRLVVSERCDGPVNAYRVRAITDACDAQPSAPVRLHRPTDPPKFISKPQDLAPAETPFLYNASAEDPQGAKLTYLLVDAPVGMTINPATGQIRWTPPAGLRGEIVGVRIAAYDGACGPKGEQSFKLAISETPPPGGFKIQVGKVYLTAGSLFRLTNPALADELPRGRSGFAPAALLQDGTYKLGGDIRINDYLHFDGSVVVTVNQTAATLDVSVDSGKVYLTNIPLIGNKTLWEGGKVAFTVDGNGEVTKLLQEQVQNPLRAGGMDIEIQRAKLLLESDTGIRIFGRLRFPDVYGITALSGEFDSLEITQQRGVRFAGNIHIADFALGGMGVRNVVATWTPNENEPSLDRFEGTGQLVTPAFEASAKLNFVGGALNGLGADLNFGGLGVPVPPGAPFFNITGGGMEVNGLGGAGRGPFSISGQVDLTLVHPALKNLISLSHAGLTYRYPSSLALNADLRILTAKAAHAYLSLDLPYQFQFKGDVKLLESFPVLLVSVDMTAGINPDPLRFFIEGGARGTLQIPAYDDFPSEIRKALPPLILAKPFLPKELLSASVAYRNGLFSTSLSVPILGELVVAAGTVNNSARLLIGRNLGSLTKVVGSAALRLAAEHPALAGDVVVGSLTVPPTSPRLIVRVQGQNVAPVFQVQPPSGPRLTVGAPGSGTFQALADTGETYFSIPNPVPGHWIILADNAGDGPFTLDGWGANAAPILAEPIVTPSKDKFIIGYSGVDPDDETPIALYYDTAPTGFHGTLIADNLPQGTNGVFTWSPAAGSLPSGDYYIYAAMDDAKNVPVQRYAPGKITIVDPAAPAAPANPKVIPGAGNSLQVQWDQNVETNLQGYLVHYVAAGTASGDIDATVDVGRTNSIRLQQLLSSTTYRISVRAYSMAAGSGGPSVHTSLSSTTVEGRTGVENPPVVRVMTPNGGEQMSSDSFTISWRVANDTNVVDQQIELSLDDGGTWQPIARHLAPLKRNFRWDPSGTMQTTAGRVRVSVWDADGNVAVATSSAPFTIAPADSDKDGIPDAWETAHGLNPMDPSDAAKATNPDGLSNLQKFRLGLDPRDPASTFQLDTTVLDNGVQLRFQSVAGKRYRVERTDDLREAVWVIVQEAIAGTGTALQITDPTPVSPTGSRFYRATLVGY